jgi:DNA-binding NarL/FixJ family response regulator
VNKETRPDQIVTVLRHVIRHKKYYTQYQAELLAESMYIYENSLHNKLTDREFQILTIIASGKKNSEIAAKLNVSKNTISNHRDKILKKLNLTNNSDITRYALEHRIIS